MPSRHCLPLKEYDKKICVRTIIWQIVHLFLRALQHSCIVKGHVSLHFPTYLISLYRSPEEAYNISRCHIRLAMMTMMLSQTNLNCLDVEWVEFQSESNPTLSHNPSTLCTSKRMSDDHLRNPANTLCSCAPDEIKQCTTTRQYSCFSSTDSTVGLIHVFSLASWTCCIFTAINLLSNQSNGLQFPMTLEWWTTLFNWNGMAENYSWAFYVF